MSIATEGLSLSVIQWDLIIGGLALFLFGIDYMGSGLKSVAGDKLRDYIDKYTNKTWKGIIIGTIITLLIQSSSATSSIAISFVRAGLMKLDQSVGIIIGANIGTTITAFLIGLNVEALALYFVFIGVMMTMFAKRKKTVYYGQVIFGFGILFFGLRLMGDELSVLKELEAFKTIATTMTEQPLISVAVGCIMTAVVQSSSATVGIIQKIYDSGAIDLYAALPFAFGASIGTTITGVFASIGGSVSARRAAVLNVIFNACGAVIFTILLVPYGAFIETLTAAMDLTPMMQIAIAHAIRAMVISIVWYPFIHVLINISKKLVPGDEEERVEVNFDSLDPNLAASLPAGALGVAKQATFKMAELAISSIKDSKSFFETKSGKFKSSSSQLEDAINSLDTKITEYLTTITHESGLGFDDMDESLQNLQVVKNIERIGDIVTNLNEFFDSVYDEKENFTEFAMEDVTEMYDVVIEMLDYAMGYFMEHDESLVAIIQEKENYLDLISEKAKKAHFTRMTKNECANGIAASVYVDIISNLERMGDHANNICKILSPNVPLHIPYHPKNLA